MLNSIKYNLSHLTDFTGRDARQTFWFYVLFLVVTQYVIGIVASIPMMVGMFGDAFTAASSGGDPQAMTGVMVENMVGYIETQTYISTTVGLVVVFLIAGSFVRRLHDAGFSGWIALIPIATQVFSLGYGIYILEDVLAMMPEMMAQQAEGGMRTNPMVAQIEAAPLSLIGWIGYLVVIGFGVLKSQEGPNRYGDAPVRF